MKLVTSGLQEASIRHTELGLEMPRPGLSMLDTSCDLTVSRKNRSRELQSWLRTPAEIQHLRNIEFQVRIQIRSNIQENKSLRWCLHKSRHFAQFNLKDSRHRSLPVSLQVLCSSAKDFDCTGSPCKPGSTTLHYTTPQGSRKYMLGPGHDLLSQRGREEPMSVTDCH